MSHVAIGRISAEAPQSAEVQAHGLLMGTRILTADGELPVEFLMPGDRIVTRSGTRVLRGVECQVIRHARVIRMEADSLGAGRPEGPLVVTPDQPVLLRDWRARALTGQAEAHLAADRLVDGALVRSGVESEARLFRLRFDTDVVIYAGGLELPCAALPVTA